MRLLFFLLHEVVARLSRHSRLVLARVQLLRFLARVLVAHALLLIHYIHLLLGHSNAGRLADCLVRQRSLLLISHALFLLLLLLMKLLESLLLHVL